MWKCLQCALGYIGKGRIRRKAARKADCYFLKAYEAKQWRPQQASCVYLTILHPNNILHAWQNRLLVKIHKK
jgi:hypothetical protein